MFVLWPPGYLRALAETPAIRYISGWRLQPTYEESKRSQTRGLYLAYKRLELTYEELKPEGQKRCFQRWIKARTLLARKWCSSYTRPRTRDSVHLGLPSDARPSPLISRIPVP
jgi:hypothetical protein